MKKILLPKGLSLVELFTTLVIVSTLGAMALPFYRDMTGKKYIEAERDQFASLIQTAAFCALSRVASLPGRTAISYCALIIKTVTQTPILPGKWSSTQLGVFTFRKMKIQMESTRTSKADRLFVSSIRRELENRSKAS